MFLHSLCSSVSTLCIQVFPLFVFKCFHTLCIQVFPHSLYSIVSTLCIFVFTHSLYSSVYTLFVFKCFNSLYFKCFNSLYFKCFHSLYSSVSTLCIQVFPSNGRGELFPGLLWREEDLQFRDDSPPLPDSVQVPGETMEPIYFFKLFLIMYVYTYIYVMFVYRIIFLWRDIILAVWTSLCCENKFFLVCSFCLIFQKSFSRIPSNRSWNSHF